MYYRFLDHSQFSTTVWLFAAACDFSLKPTQQQLLRECLLSGQESLLISHYTAWTFVSSQFFMVLLYNQLNNLQFYWGCIYFYFQLDSTGLLILQLPVIGQEPFLVFFRTKISQQCHCKLAFLLNSWQITIISFSGYKNYMGSWIIHIHII